MDIGHGHPTQELSLYFSGLITRQSINKFDPNLFKHAFDAHIQTCSTCARAHNRNVAFVESRRANKALMKQKSLN